jgi:hypothetical protein
LCSTCSRAIDWESNVSSSKRQSDEASQIFKRNKKSKSKQNIIQRIKAVAAVRAERKDAAATTAAELQPENRLQLKMIMMQKTIWMLLMLLRMRNLRLSLKSSIRPQTDFQ